MEQSASAGGATIAEFASQQISSRLGHLAFQVAATAQNPGPDAVHDLRVAVRRFVQSLRVFLSLLPPAEVKRIRKRLNRIMDAAGETRECDIALEFIGQAGVPKEDALTRKIVRQRELHGRNLLLEVRRLHRTDFSARWRTALQLYKL